MPQSASQKVTTHAKRVRCVELAAQGMSYDAIAQAVGYSNRGGAYKAVSAALRAQQAEAVDELRVLELERLDALQRSCWDAALEGDIPAVDRVLRVIAARVRLLGLDQNTDKPAAGGGRLVSLDWQPDLAELGSSSRTGRENLSGDSSSASPRGEHARDHLSSAGTPSHRRRRTTLAPALNHPPQPSAASGEDS